MKKLLQSYLSFTRIERIGLVCLCALLMLLIAIRVFMHLWVHPDMDREKEKKLVNEWEAFKKDRLVAATDTTGDDKEDDSVIVVQNTGRRYKVDSPHLREVIRYKQGK